MMKPFKITDMGHFLPNEHSHPDMVLDQLLGENYVTVSLWNEDNMVSAILCFTCYWGKNWSGFFLISKDFMPHEAMIIRDYVRSTMKKLDADRLQTDSEDIRKINRWHEFLGFKLEGTRKRAIYGKDFNMWAIMREDLQ